MSTNMAATNRTTDSITVRAWYGGSTPVYHCVIYCDGEQVDFQHYLGGSTNWTTSWYTKNYLSSGTIHDFYAIFYDNNSQEIERTSYFSWGTKIDTPSLSFSSSGTDSITMNVGWVRGAYYYDLQIYDSSYSYLGSVSTTSYGAVTISHSDISGIVSGSTYRVTVSARDYWGECIESDESGYVTATTTSSRPDYFDWTYAGQTVEGSPVSGTTKSSSYRLYVTAAEWNALLDNIRDVWAYKGWTNPGIYYVSQGGTMTAAQFNAVNDAICVHVSTGVSSKTAGSSDIMAADFNALRTALNSIS